MEKTHSSIQSIRSTAVCVERSTFGNPENGSMIDAMGPTDRTFAGLRIHFIRKYNPMLNRKRNPQRKMLAHFTHTL
jgi:hypothetical protein